MRKENILFGVFGLVVGMVIGFVFANSVNKTEVSSIPSSSQTLNQSNPAIPPDHPPIGGPMSDSSQTSAIPQVMESIEKAKQQPENFEAQMTAADLYYQIQRFDEAAKYYEAANKLRPAEAEPIIKAGNAHFDAERYEIAEKWYVQALEKEPRNINVRTDLGLTFYLRTPRDVQRAIKEYKAALSINPDHEITLQNLALAYNDASDKEALRVTIDKLRKLNPSNPAIARLEGSL